MLVAYFIGVIFAASMTPFSYESRKEIGAREKWTCEDCGRRFQDGFMVDASHNCHDRDENYDNPDNGCIQCLHCHLVRHIEIMQDEESDWSVQSVRLIAMRAYNNGLHTYNYSTEETLVNDRNEVIELLESYGLDTDFFLGSR